MSAFGWLISDTESGKRSHLSDTGEYIFCAPMWGKITFSEPYEGHTSYKGKPLCKNCEKAGTTRAAAAIVQQYGGKSTALWLLYQTANGTLRIAGKTRQPAIDSTPPKKKRANRA